jgi:hypothetical protein
MKGTNTAADAGYENGVFKPENPVLRPTRRVIFLSLSPSQASASIL